MDIIVTIEKINDVQEFASKKDGTVYKKFSFVGRTNEQFPQTICFTCGNEEVWNKFNLTVGLQVQAFFSLRSREWNGKWYTEVNCWKIMPMGGVQHQETKAQATQQQVAKPNTNDDVPF